MKILLKYLLIVAMAATTSSAMRADDLSDLVAAVAAGEKTIKNIESDVLTIRFDSLPRYISKKDSQTIDLLSGIYDSMSIESTLNYMINAYDYSDLRPQQRLNYSDYWLQQPTLAREGFYRPVPGIITSRFGWRPQFGRMHHGVDLRLNIGDTVRAAVTGVVEKVAYDYDGYGHYVVMRHPDGMETVYGHLQYALVGQGQQIEMGYPVGIGGNTGNSTGPHLHFEARMGGVAVDPTLIFDFYSSSRYYAKNRNSEPGTSTYASKPLSGKRTYIVRQGDTTKSIAKRAGISVLRLCQLNMIKETDRLETGRMLKLR